MQDIYDHLIFKRKQSNRSCHRYHPCEEHQSMWNSQINRWVLRIQCDKWFHGQKVVVIFQWNTLKIKFLTPPPTLLDSHQGLLAPSDFHHLKYLKSTWSPLLMATSSEMTTKVDSLLVNDWKRRSAFKQSFSVKINA